MTESTSGRRLLQVLGPGLLLGALSIGVSHLVQATRAGAEYGVVMAAFIAFAIVTKYPTFRFAPRYTLATGVSLVEGLRRRGLWALGLFAVVLLGDVFVGVAAVSFTTAGILKVTLGLSWQAVPLAVALIVVTASILVAGRYHWLHRLIKPLMILLTVSTLLATAAALPLVDWSDSAAALVHATGMQGVLFAAALIGWMPAPLSSAAIQSLWVQAQVRDTGYRPSLRETTLDFHVGYALTFVLGLCFLLLGAAVMAGPGTVLEAGAAGFAGQLIDLYAQTLGEWSRPVTGLAALAVMYSTLLALIDGLSRVSAALVLRVRLPEEPEAEFRPAARGMLYVGCVFVISAGAVVILLTLVRSFRSLIDLATTIAFLTTPLIAYLVHRCMHAPEVPPEARPGAGMRRFSEVCIGLLILFAGGYLLLLLVRG